METVQLPLNFTQGFPVIKSDERGIKKAEKTADKIDPTFNERLYKFLCEYVRNGQPFMAETVRESAERVGIVAPASKRVMGSIIRRASKEGVIRCIGTAKVKNETAHFCFASLWVIKTDNV